ncbi:MAG: phosphatase PAP2 family protein [Dysgonamonadaceae bacterium]|jgi:hypothetical protein|nr:phosphatase PAP2 family protein [Dysgonamonadaceae bacterium]
MYLIKTKVNYFHPGKSFRYAVALFCLPFFSSRAQMADSLLLEMSVEKETKFVFSNAHTIIAIGVPASLITYGLTSIKNPALLSLDRNVANSLYRHRLLIHGNQDDYLQYSPAVAAFGLKFCGVESEHRLQDMAVICLLSATLETGVVHTFKGLTGRRRPNGKGYHSSPSGHTATAFAAAEFLYQEYKDKSIWIGMGGYVMASFIGASRILRDRHWVSDVIAGVGIGILSTKIVYWSYPYLQELFAAKDSPVFICPSYSNGGLSLNFSYNFR